MTHRIPPGLLERIDAEADLSTDEGKFIHSYVKTQVLLHEVTVNMIDDLREDYPELPPFEQLDHILASLYYSIIGNNKYLSSILKNAPARVNLGDYDPINITDFIFSIFEDTGKPIKIPKPLCSTIMEQLKYPHDTVHLNYYILAEESKWVAKQIYFLSTMRKKHKLGFSAEQRTRMRERETQKKRSLLLREKREKMKKEKKLLASRKKSRKESETSNIPYEENQQNEDAMVE